jgi:hypothetical protein
MHLHLEPAAAGRRGLLLPLIGGVPALLGAAALALLAIEGQARIRLCPLHALTGIPCPACGGTRAALALASGAPAEALALNPLLILALPAAGLMLLARVLCGQRVALDTTPAERRGLLVILLFAVIANEAWLIAAGV